MEPSLKVYNGTNVDSGGSIMANTKQVKTEVWVGVLVGVIVLYALIADWASKHPIPFWVVTVGIVGGSGYILYKYPQARRKVWGFTSKTAKDLFANFGTVEEETYPRTPIPVGMRRIVEARADGRCENPGCTEKGNVRCQYHHIDGDRDHHSVTNIAYLCPNCHNKAHHTTDKLTVKRWINDNYRRRKPEIDKVR